MDSVEAIIPRGRHLMRLMVHSAQKSSSGQFVSASMSTRDLRPDATSSIFYMLLNLSTLTWSVHGMQSEKDAERLVKHAAPIATSNALNARDLLSIISL